MVAQMTHPETCPRCGAPRTMVDEGRAFYKCGSIISTLSGKTTLTDCTSPNCIFCGIVGPHTCSANIAVTQPRSVCVMCGKETEEEMQSWLSKGNLRLFVCPKCDAEMTAMAVKS